MLRPLVAIVFCLLAGAASAAAIQKNPQESIKDFAARYAPNSASEVVHVVSSSVWDYDKPVIVAFYEYPVSYADKSKNYGDSPGESEVLGVIFVPVNSSEFKKYEIDGYGPEGGNAGIKSVFFAKADRTSDEKLFVIVSWQTNNGAVYSTYIYEKPQINSSESKLFYLEKLSQTFGMECDYCRDGDSPGRPAKYKTAADVKAKLKKLIK